MTTEHTLQQLKEIAEAADQPEWFTAEDLWRWNFVGRYNGAYVISMRPAVALDLIAQVEKLEAERNDLVECMKAVENWEQTDASHCNLDERKAMHFRRLRYIRAALSKVASSKEPAKEGTARDGTGQ